MKIGYRNIGALAILMALCAMAGCSSKAPTDGAKSPDAKETTESKDETKSEASQTLTNLQTAFNGESNASAKYAVYGDHAKGIGYARASSLFSAASAAEKIHATRHAKEIRALGAEPKAEIGTYGGKTIEEMLKDAIAGETHEFTEMYPEFIETAVAEKNGDAEIAFNYAMKAEVEHAKLYTEALGDLEGWKASGAAFLVCPVCGFTSEDEALGACPICATVKEKFVEFK